MNPQHGQRKKPVNFSFKSLNYDKNHRNIFILKYVKNLVNSKLRKCVRGLSIKQNETKLPLPRIPLPHNIYMYNMRKQGSDFLSGNQVYLGGIGA